MTSPAGFFTLFLYRLCNYDLHSYNNSSPPWSVHVGLFCVLWQKFEKKYNSELAKGAVSKETKFEYAWCLIRSKYTQDIKKGVVLLEGETSKYIQCYCVYCMCLIRRYKTPGTVTSGLDFDGLCCWSLLSKFEHLVDTQQIKKSERKCIVREI